MSHPVLEALASTEPAVRAAACREAAEDPSAVLLIEALGDRLGDSDRAVRRAASDALATIGKRASEVDAILKRALRSDHLDARWAAAYTIARLGPPGPALLPAVVEALASRDGDIRWSAARLLVDMGRLHPEVLGVVLGLARAADDAVVQRMALFCLRELAPDDPGAVHALIEATLERDPALRRAALTTLAALLDPPAAVAKRLVDALRSDSDPACRRLAAVALGELGARCPGSVGEPPRSALREAAARGDDPHLQRAAEHALARLQAAGQGAA